MRTFVFIKIVPLTFQNTSLKFFIFPKQIQLTSITPDLSPSPSPSTHSVVFLTHLLDHDLLLHPIAIRVREPDHHTRFANSHYAELSRLLNCVVFNISIRKIVGYYIYSARFTNEIKNLCTPIAFENCYSVALPSADRAHGMLTPALTIFQVCSHVLVCLCASLFSLTIFSAMSTRSTRRR